MSPLEIVILVSMLGYAVWRQTQRHEVVGASRFKLAIIYGIVGLVVGGFHLPHSGSAIALLATTIALSIIFGLMRGRYTRVWAEDGRVYSQGTVLTVSLFFVLIAAKFGLGTIAYLEKLSNDGGFGEILLMIAVMVAFQAEIVWRRARQIGARQVGTPAVMAA